MVRIIVQEEKMDPEPDELEHRGRRTFHLETTDEVASEKPEVIAAFLRALANKFDPPKAITR